jgi:predicted Zn-dependent protease
MYKSLLNMKSLFIAVMAIFMTMPIVAQDAMKDMKKAARSTGSYRLDPEANKDKLVEAKDLIDGAINSPELASEVKAWQTLGEVYAEVINGEVRLLAISQDTPIVNKDAPTKTVKGFTKAYTLAEKGFEKRDALKGLSGILNNISYLGSIMLSGGNFTDSYDAYDALISGNDFLIANGEPSVYADEEEFNQQVYWAALAAYSGTNYPEAEKQFGRLYEADYDSPDIYSAMYDIRKKTGDMDGANAILQEGMKKYPEDKGLMFAEINDALARGDLEALVGKLKAAMEAEPDNITIPTTLGNVYDQMYQKAIADEDFETAAEHYKNAKIYFAQALAIDDNFFDAVYMMGAVEYNRAAQLAAELNLLAEDYSKEGTKKYDSKKAEMMIQFDKALPYFVKAETIKGTDRNTLIALREIYARKDQLDKSNEYKEKIESLPGND